MKESYSSVDKRCIFKETFNDEQSVNRNGGTVSGGIFKNGTWQSNGGSISFRLPRTTAITIRLRFRSMVQTTYSQPLRLYKNGVYLNEWSLSTNGRTTVLGGTNYNNGISSNEMPTTTATKWFEYTFTKNGFPTYDTLAVGAFNGASFVIELFEIYAGSLTANEIKLLYKNKQNKLLNKQSNLLLDLDCTDGIIKDKTGLRTLTNAGVSVRKNNNNFVINSNAVNINCESDFINVLPVTVCFWIYSKQPNNLRSIISNDKFYIYYYQRYMTMDSNFGIPGTNTGVQDPINTWYFYAITRQGTTGNYYRGTTSTTPTLTASPYNSGTPTAGTRNVSIGRYNNNQVFDGYYNQIKVWQGILTQEEITQIWMSTKNLYI